MSVCPNFSSRDAAFVLQKEWSLSGKIKALDSYLDQNFLLQTDTGAKYVLKIANKDTPQAYLDLQCKVVVHLASDLVATTVPSQSGSEMILYQGHWCRVLTFLEGIMLASVPFRSLSLLQNIGKYIGEFSSQLNSFEHPAAERYIQWDLQYSVALIQSGIDLCTDVKIKEALQQTIQTWNQYLPQINGLRRSVIHADLTRYNLLVDDKAEHIQGIIDFGDVCLTWTLGELAVLILESVMTGSTTPFEDAYQVVKAYHAHHPLTKTEVELLYIFIQQRSAAIVAASIKQLSLNPDNQYIQKQAVLDQEMFLRLNKVTKNYATALFMDACGLLNHPLEELKNRISTLKIYPIFRHIQQLKNIDLSPISDIYNEAAWENKDTLKQNILHQLAFGYGFSNYLTSFVHQDTFQLQETASIALGIYLFAPSETHVFAPLDLIFIKKEATKAIFKFEDVYIYITGLEMEHQQANTHIKAGHYLGTVQDDVQSAYPPNIYIQFDFSGVAPSFALPSEVRAWALLGLDASVILGVKSTSLINKQVLNERRSKTIQQAQEYYYQQPMNLVRAWQQYLIDADGRVYLDAINNVTHIGHSHPKVTAAAVSQFQKLNTNARFLYQNNIKYAERLLAKFPKHLNVIFFTCTGSEANDLALRLARAYTNQQDILVIDGEYHGNTTAVDEISTCLLDNPTVAKTVRTYTHPLVQPNTFRGKYRENTAEVAELYAQDAVEKIKAIHLQGRGVAGFISESLLGSGGGVEMPKGYLKAIYHHVHQAGGVCIADEVQIGFGRMGTHFWGFEKEGVSPDIVTLGKPMGNGYPISAVITTQQIADAYKQKHTYFNTFAGNAVACEIADAVLSVIEKDKMQEKAHAVGTFLKGELEKLIDEFEIVGAIYGHAMYLGIDLVEDKISRTPATEKALWLSEAMKQQGIIIYPTGDYYNILKIKPPLCFSHTNAQYLVQTLRKILATM